MSIGLASRLLVAVVLASAPLLAGAKVHVCIGPDGRKSIQDVPCPAPPVKATAPVRPCAMTDPEWNAAALRESSFLERHRSAADHWRSTRAKLETAVGQLKPMLARLDFLLGEHKALMKELAFFEKTPPPASLLAKVDTNTSQLKGLPDAFRRVQESIEKIAVDHRCEVATFGGLWTGAASGVSACHRPACLPS